MPLVLNSQNGFFVIGGRINPSGNKKMAAAFENLDWDALITEAERQLSAGADAVDLNAGLVPDSGEWMRQAVRAFDRRGIGPLAIDSASLEVLKAGLGEAKQKVLLNSVRGDDESLKTLLPVIAERGIPFIGMAMDGRDIPGSWKTRLQIAEKIAARAKDYGIPEKDMMMDCVALPLRYYPEAVSETLEAVKAVRESLGIGTCLGISNISFGLKRRERVNAAYLRLARAYGLRSGILNPLEELVMEAAREQVRVAPDPGNILKFKEAYANNG